MIARYTHCGMAILPALEVLPMMAVGVMVEIFIMFSERVGERESLSVHYEPLDSFTFRLLYAALYPVHKKDCGFLPVRQAKKNNSADVEVRR